MAEQAYATTDPAIVAAFAKACVAERHFAESVVESAQAIGKNKGALRESGAFGAPRTIGLAADNPADPPEGWRYLKGQDMLSPRQGKAGDSARQWLKQFQPTVWPRSILESHGLPYNDLLGEADVFPRKFNVPRVFMFDGTIWALYTGTPGSWITGAIEPTWERRKLSEYHAALEAHQANEAAGGKPGGEPS